MRFVDFCAGIGGFRLGLEELGLGCVYSCDIDDNCEKTYQDNFLDKFDAKDIKDVVPAEISSHDIFCAGFPCQPFSIAGKRNGFSDDRSNVFDHIIRILTEISSPIILLENVKHLLHHDKGKTFKTILAMLSKAGYFVKYKVINSKGFGVPQNRERIYIVGFLNESFYSQFSFPTLNGDVKSINDILEKGVIEHPVSDRWLEYIDLYSGKKTIEEIPFDVPKTRKQLEKPIGSDTNFDDHILQMRSSGIRAIHISKQIPTFAVSISGGGAMIPIYAGEKRHLNLVEMKRIMGFPDDFIFSVAKTHAIKQLANAVCPQVITAIGSEILKAVQKESAISIIEKKHLFDHALVQSSFIE